MRIFKLSEIRPIIEDKPSVLEAVKQGFVAHSQGLINLPTPLQMVFHRDNKTIAGDCHVKAAASSQYPYFCLKIATGFYDNTQLGLPVNNGLVMLMSAETGAPLALFQDDGYMTSIRTAAAGALSAGLAAGVEPKRVGIIGTGHQAELQAKWIAATLTISALTVWGRSQEKAKALVDNLAKSGIAAQTAETPASLCERSDIIVTTTPAAQPILMHKYIRPGHHIIAMGADSPGKQELDSAIIAKADRVIIDDVEQCAAHGELGWAIRAGLIQREKAVPLGQVLAQKTGAPIGSDQITVVDLTGLGAQDLALAALVYSKLSSTE